MREYLFVKKKERKKEKMNEIVVRQVALNNEAMFSSKKFSIVPVTSNLRIYVWSIKYS